MCQFGDHAQAVDTVDTQVVVFAQYAECQRLQGIARKDGGGLVVGPVAGWAAASEVIVIHRRQVIVHQGVGVDQLHRTGGPIQAVRFCPQGLAGGVHENRTYPLAATQRGVAHGAVQIRGLGGCRWQPTVQRTFDALPAVAQKDLKSRVKRHLRTVQWPHPGCVRSGSRPSVPPPAGLPGSDG